MRVLITGGAGFVGAALAREFRRDHPAAEIVAFDNLKRRGSEINVGLHADQGIKFVHGDIRVKDDLLDLEGSFDVFIEASAEPSVHAGLGSAPNYLTGTNLTGTLNCLELARQRAGAFIFLSTSRVYSIAPLKALPLTEDKTRFTVQNSPWSHGIAEDFPTHLPRSLYGATKLASELMIQEYAESYRLRSVINRCGVIAGPGQFGKVDQGVFTLWVAHHHFGKPLKYTGFGAKGKQVRDLLHPADLYQLIKRELSGIDQISGSVFNAGGGLDVSVSMQEMTRLAQAATGREVQVAADPATSPVDIPWYVTDARKALGALGWLPEIRAERIVQEIAAWVKTNETALKRILT